MGITEDLADDLARDTLALIKDTGEDGIVEEIATLIGASSTTMQEAYLTAVRVRRAEARARGFLRERTAKHNAL